MEVGENIITPEKVHDLRRRILAGEEYTKEELREQVRAMFGARIANAQAVATTTKRPKKSVNLDDLISPSAPNLDDLIS